MFIKSSKCESHTCVEVDFHKSSKSMEVYCVEVGFKKSSKSPTDYHCVEVACNYNHNVLIRDSKVELNSAEDNWLSVSPQAWTAFLGSLA